jgi:hypothetical protein
MEKKHLIVPVPTVTVGRSQRTPKIDCHTILTMVVAAFLSWSGWMTNIARAQDSSNVEVVLKDHRYTPSTLKVPAGKSFIITIRNEDATPEEFESSTLKIEKIVPGDSSASVHVRPRTAGHYNFVGEQHEDTAKGELLAE